MFSKARVGDEIFSMRDGVVRIVEIDSSHATYPIRVEYGSCLAPDTRWITVDGKQHANDRMPTYFWSKPEVIIPPRPLPELEVDTPVLVRDAEDYSWISAHFAGWEGSRIQTWGGGRTSHTTEVKHSWDQWKLPGN